MKKHKIWLAALMTCALVLGATGCGEKEEAAASPEEAAQEEVAEATGEGQSADEASQEETSEPAQAGEKLTFAIVIPNIHPFFDPIEVGAKDKLAEMGIEADIICEGPMNGDVSAQIQIMEDLITKKVDGIAIGACDSDALTPYIDKAVDAGIPVVSFDTDAPDSKRAGYIGTDNYKAGEAMGEVLGEALGGKGKVICETGVVSQAGLIQRIDGVQAVLDEKYPDIEIVQTTASGGDVSKALSDIENMITAVPDFDALIIIDAAGENGVTAFKSHGWTKEDKVLITFDDLEPVINGVKDGQIHTTITQGQYNWGVNIVEKLYELSQGKEIPENTDTGYVIVNADNVNDTY